MTDSEYFLKDFEQISLQEMEGVKLMDRLDRKYIFSVNALEMILKELRFDYKALEIDGRKANRYETIYYDTLDFAFYKAHHNGKLSRYKVRQRNYLESGLGFLEIKQKNNKGRTIKKRIANSSEQNAWNQQARDFLLKNLPLEPLQLSRVLQVNYKRHTLVNKNGAERLTLDLDLEFKKDVQTKKIQGLVIAELKQDKKVKSAFHEIMKKYNIYERPVSKYCLGIAYTVPYIKTNNFKETLNIINTKII